MRLITSTIFAVVTSLAFFHCGGDTSSQPDSGGDDASDIDSGDQVDAQVDAGPDVDNGAPSTTYPAFKIDAPQVQNFGGALLTAPKVVPVYFANDDTTFTGNVTTFLDKLPASTYWPAISTEYGMGAMTVTTPVQLTEDAPTTIDDTAIKTWLAGKMGDPAWPTADANTVYTIFYPTGTSITLQGDTSCDTFGGYHDSFPLNNTTNIAYAVVPRCAKFNGLVGIDATTGAASHELIEASTDPQPSQDAAYAQVDDNHIIFELINGGGEVGDMCVASQNAFFTPTDLGSMVQRIWSNANAKAGHNPCVPTDGSPYFNAMPVMSTVTIQGLGTTEGVTIPIGQSKTIEVDLFSDAATSPWTVSATDLGGEQQGDTELTFAWDRTTGQNGEKLHVTITAVKASQYGAEAFAIDSILGTSHNFWVGLVGN
jgi:hypothetical protein